MWNEETAQLLSSVVDLFSLFYLSLLTLLPRSSCCVLLIVVVATISASSASSASSGCDCCLYFRRRWCCGCVLLPLLRLGGTQPTPKKATATAAAATAAARPTAPRPSKIRKNFWQQQLWPLNYLFPTAAADLCSFVMFFSARLDLGETPCVFVSERLASLRLLLLNLSLSFSLVLIDLDYFTKPVPHFSLLSHPLLLGFNFNGLSCESCMCCFCLLPTCLPADYHHLHPNTDSLFFYTLQAKPFSVEMLSKRWVSRRGSRELGSIQARVILPGHN